MLQPLIEGVLRGHKKFKLIGILQILSSVVFLVSAYVGIRIDGVNGAMIGMMAYYCIYAFISVAAIANTSLSVKKIRSDTIGIMSEFSVVRRMILPVFLLSFIDAPIMWIAQLLLSNYGSMESIGSMTAVMQIRNLAILIPSYFSSTFIAFAGDMNARKDYTTYFRMFDRMMRWFILAGTGMFVLFSVTSPWILSFYGAEYISDWPLMVLASIGIPCLMLMSLTKIDLIIQEHQQALLYISIAWNIVWIVSLYILLALEVIPVYAFFISQLLGFGLQCAIILILYNKDKKRLQYEKTTV